MRDWLRVSRDILVFLLALTLVLVVYDVRQSARDARQERRLAVLEAADVEQLSLLLCGVEVDRRMADLLDGLIEADTQLEVDGKPDEQACAEEEKKP